MNNIWPWIAGILPSVGLGLIFWYALRAIVRADRNERAAEAELDAEDAHRDAA